MWLLSTANFRTLCFHHWRLKWSWRRNARDWWMARGKGLTICIGKIINRLSTVALWSIGTRVRISRNYQMDSMYFFVDSGRISPAGEYWLAAILRDRHLLVHWVHEESHLVVLCGFLNGDSYYCCELARQRNEQLCLLFLHISHQIYDRQLHTQCFDLNRRVFGHHHPCGYLLHHLHLLSGMEETLLSDYCRSID